MRSAAILLLLGLAASASALSTTDSSFTTAEVTTAGGGSTVGGGDVGCAEWPGLDEFCEGKPNGDYAYPCNCRKYVECEQAPANILWLCENEWLYNEAQDFCDTIDRVDCDERPLCDENDENCEAHDIETPAPPTYCLEENIDPSQWVDCADAPEGTVFSEEPCSNLYCTCTNGYVYPIENECGNGLVWNPAIQGCDRCSNTPTCTGDEDVCTA